MNRVNALKLAISLALAGTLASCGGSSSTSVATVSVPDPLAAAGITDLTAASFGFSDGGGGDGGGGDGGAGGDAGDGSPFRKAVIVVTDATGKSVTGLTDDNGNYFVKFSNFKSPLIAKVIDAGGNVLTSDTEESVPVGKAVRIMINPLTDKIVSDAVATSTVKGTDKTFDGSKIDVAKLVQGKKDLLDSVRPALISVGVTSTAEVFALCFIFDNAST